MRDHRFLSQLPTSYLQGLLAHGGLAAEEKATARTVLSERKQPFKAPQRHKSKKARSKRQPSQPSPRQT